ncbi:hypothetical protein M409DRAFT_54444 [Zasmidium cellare ATCC 36951]|uniref:Uncharacterized protein n=1 Tax=Zasmidium cellare ATCC 36951 TaxID=1080233 RepID=A0A6A6CP59_ZASCE|nr:uncharacterized protein M409DRAFT_54444 [Zasmidium cellare ATCC 36951]KAF2167266.1 hypothetical protein M409DRAFT_54444 [Zasmidium cellare ATCC 36951]
MRRQGPSRVFSLASGHNWIVLAWTPGLWSGLSWLDLLCCLALTPSFNRRSSWPPSDVTIVGLQRASVELYGMPDAMKGKQHVFPGGAVDDEERKLCVWIVEASKLNYGSALQFPVCNSLLDDDDAAPALAMVAMCQGLGVVFLLNTFKENFSPRVYDHVDLFQDPAKYGHGPALRRQGSETHET